MRFCAGLMMFCRKESWSFFRCHGVGVNYLSFKMGLCVCVSVCVCDCVCVCACVCVSPEQVVLEHQNSHVLNQNYLRRVVYFNLLRSNPKHNRSW